MELLLQRARFPCLVDHGHIVDFADNETFLRRKLAIFLFAKRCGLELCFCFPEIRVRTVVDIVVKEILLERIAEAAATLPGIGDLVNLACITQRRTLKLACVPQD